MTDTPVPPTIPAPTGIQSFGDVMVETIRPLDGTYYPSAEGARWLEPNDTLAEALLVENLWDCEVTSFRTLCMALLACGIPCPESTRKFVPGAIAAWLPNLGIRLDALEDAAHHDPLDPPWLGDIALLDHATGPHSSNLIDDDGTGIDGGQLKPGTNIKGIRLRRRIYPVENGVLVARDIDGPGESIDSPGPAAKVLWIIRARLVQV